MLTAGTGWDAVSVTVNADVGDEFRTDEKKSGVLSPETGGCDQGLSGWLNARTLTSRTDNGIGRRQRRQRPRLAVATGQEHC